MLRKIKDLIQYSIHTLDDSIAQADDFLLDDETWVIRYLVVDLGDWLSERNVLISCPRGIVPKPNIEEFKF